MLLNVKSVALVTAAPSILPGVRATQLDGRNTRLCLLIFLWLNQLLW